jgi:hypothetical protein
MLLHFTTSNYRVQEQTNLQSGCLNSRRSQALLPASVLDVGYVAKDVGQIKILRPRHYVTVICMCLVDPQTVFLGGIVALNIITSEASCHDLVDRRKNS